MYLFRKEGPYLDQVSSSVQLAAGDGDSRRRRWQMLRHFIRELKPDVVVSFLSYFTVLTAARTAAVGARVVFNQQTPMTAFLSDRDYQWRRAWHRRAFALATRAGYAAADLVVTTSQGVADDLVTEFGVSREQIEVVHNPVDLDAVRRGAGEAIDLNHAANWQRPTIVAAGRLAEAKNYPLMIEALANLQTRMSARLLILGEGHEEGALRSLIAARGLRDQVLFCGFQKNPWKYIARADVFLLTSHYEGFGNVLVEAMACGVPVVATASAGTRDIVRQGVDGVLVERHEAGAVATALESVLGNDAGRQRMADAARAGAERFALPAVAANYDRLFQRLVA